MVQIGNHTGVIEWAPFRTRAGVTEAQLAAASDRLQREFLAGARGFVRRELLRGKDGDWVDLVYWENQESASAIMPAVMEHPAAQQYFALMDIPEEADPAGGVAHFAIRRSY